MSVKKEILFKLHLCKEARAGRYDMSYVPDDLREEIINELEQKYMSELAVIEALELINPKRTLLTRILSAIKPSWL